MVLGLLLLLFSVPLRDRVGLGAEILQKNNRQ